MGIKFKEALEKLGGKCPVCGNSDHTRIEAAAKKNVKGAEQVYLFCLDCGCEITRECDVACIAYISRIVKVETGETIKRPVMILFKDLKTYFTVGNPDVLEIKIRLNFASAFIGPIYDSLFRPIPKTNNEQQKPALA